MSRGPDKILRPILASPERRREAERPRTFGEAARSGIFERVAEAAKGRNAGRSAAEIARIVDDALAWARRV